jgi:outer membrane protein TolC
VVDALTALGTLDRELVRYEEAERSYKEALQREIEAQQG